MTTRVSIVIPAMNVAGYIGTAIRSVLAQTYPAWDLVVIDDGSIDATAAIVEAFDDPRIRVIRQPHTGLSAARNHGIAATDGDAVLLLDGDDWLAPDASARLVASLAAAPTAVAAYGAFGFVRETDEPGAVPTSIHPGPRLAGDMVEQVLLFCPFVIGSVLVRRSAMLAVGPYRVELGFAEDWEYWVRLALSGPFVREAGPVPVAYIRRRFSGLYLRHAANPDAVAPAFAAIFGNPLLRERLGKRRVTDARRRAKMEHYWAIGRELVRHGQPEVGQAWLRRSVGGVADWRRAMHFVLSRIAPSWLARINPQFRPYDRNGLGTS